MSKYENPENINNMVLNQMNMPGSVYNQNDTLNYRQVFQGNIGIRNQGISMQTTIPAQLQHNLGSFNYGHHHGYIQQSQYPHLVPQLLNNIPNVHMQPNLIRQNVLPFHQSQPQNIFKIGNQHGNFVIGPNFQTGYHAQSQPIQQQLPHHIQTQISPHIGPQNYHSSLIHNSLSNQFHLFPVRQSVSVVNEKHCKENLALPIINPETNMLIDLKSFNTDKNLSNTAKLELKVLKEEFDECPANIIHPLEKHEYHNNTKMDIKENVEEKDSNINEMHRNKKTDNIENCEILIEKIDLYDSCIHKNDEPEINIDEDKSLDRTTKSLTLKWPYPVSAEIQEIVNQINVLEIINKDPKEAEMNILVEKIIEKEIPVNTNGQLNKFIYSREELIKIGKNALSQQKPNGLPFKEEFTDPIILDYSINISGLENMESMQYINQKYTKGNKTSQNISNSWRPSNTKNLQVFPKHITLDNAENILLRSDDGYVTFKQRLAAGEELSETEELVRQIKGILNRIVPQNFDQCLDDLVSLKIGTQEGMNCLVNELFLKAVKEEAYSMTFAKICSYLASIKADVSDHEIVTFRSVLLQKCQAMFTTPLKEQLEKVRNDWLFKASTEKPKTKALMESDVDEQIKKAKDRYYGNIRFIGELYLKGVLITRIICYCIENLLTKENDADSLICLCKLLETCGAKLETESKGKEKLNESFKKLRELSESVILETRVRFRILDILEMRQQKWCLRKVQQEQKIQPKTLEEIKIEKEMEEAKEHCSSLNRKPTNNWTPDRRQSLPNVVSKSRTNFVPQNLTVTCSNNDSTTLGPQKRNWSVGSGSTINTNVIDNDKRINKHKGKINSETRPKDNNSIYELVVESSTDSTKGPIVEGCVSNYALCYVTQPTFNAFNYQSVNSSENSSRSSSHGRSTPQILSKEKISDSKSAHSTLLKPFELFKEYRNSDHFCEDSWNMYSNKVDVVYEWLDTNFETSHDNRTSLSNLLSRLINQNMMDKVDLLSAFSKLIDSLEDLIIDVGLSIWDSLCDYLIPFLESGDIDSIDLLESIFNFEILNKFKEKNTCVIYSLPWSMTNKILKSSNVQKCRDIFRLAVEENYSAELLTTCEKKLISIISTNLSRAAKIGICTDIDFFLNWISMRNKESFNSYSQQFFMISNWKKVFEEIRTDSFPGNRLAECFKMISSMSKENDIMTALCKIANENSENNEGIYLILRRLVETNTCDINTINSWESQSHNSINFPLSLRHVLTVFKNKSAFNLDTPYESLLTFDSKNYFNYHQSTFDSRNCTNSD